MQVEFKLLEDNVFSLVTLCKTLQNEKSLLQKEIHSLSKKNVELEKKVEEARLRIENILASLPGVGHVG